jgi:MFS transporter, ACS family, allantoate permease
MMSESPRKSASDEVEKSPVDDEKSELHSVNDSQLDEALHLVGLQRSAEFSEEYNRKLRRKLVAFQSFSHHQIPDWRVFIS